jgi:pantoate kinase
MEVSRDFAESLGLLSSRLKKLIDIADKQGFICSQAMFGETLFSIVKESEVAKLIETFRGAAPFPHWIINAAVDNEGARFL